MTLLRNLALWFTTLAIIPLSISAEVTLTARTSDNSINTYASGQEFALKFRMTGVPEQTDEILTVNIVDEHSRPVRSYTIPLTPMTNDETRVRYSDDMGNSNFLWKVDVNPPTNRLGFFQVFAELKDVTKIAPCGRLGNYITYAIVPDPFLREQYPWEDSFFGLMCPRGGSRPLIGASVDLFNYQSHHWSRFEPDRPGQFKELMEKHAATPWEVISPQTQVHDFNVNGKNLKWRCYNLPFTFSPPEWASVPGTRAHMTASLTPEGEKAWGEFCFELAAAYARVYPNDTVQHFEISTEPVFGWGYKGTPEDLVKVHRIAYEAMHKANPKAKVGGPAFTGVGNGEDWTFVEAHQTMFDKGIGNYIDVLHMHPYFGQPEESQFIQKIRAIKKMMRDSVGHEIPMAGTEGGYSYRGESTENWLKKAWSDVRGSLIMLGEGFVYNIAFYGNSGPNANEEAWGFHIEGTNSLSELSPIPVVPAFAAMSFLLEGHKSAGSIEWLGETAWGYAYQRSNDIVLAVWDWSGKPRQVDIPVGADSVTVYDWMGNPGSVASPNGVVNLTLTKDPLYIKGVAIDLWSSNAVKAIAFEKSQVEVYPGQTLPVTLTCQKSGQLSFKDNPVLGLAATTMDLSLDNNDTTQVVLQVVIPTDTAAGTYPISAILLEGDTPRAAAGCMVRVLAPAAITYLRPTLTSEGPALRVKLKADIDVKGQISVAVTDVETDGKAQAVGMKAGDEMEFTFPLTGASLSPIRLYDARTLMITDQGSRVELERRLSFIEARRVDKPIVIDGQLGEWNDIPSVRIEAPDGLRVPAGQINDTNDLAADVRFAWDTNALYLLFEVEDNVHQQPHSGEATWMCDCIQIGLNLDPEQVRAGAMSTLEAGGMRRWQEIDIARSPNGPDVFRTMTYDNRFCPASPLSPEQAPLATTRDEETKRTVYEFAVPWTTLTAIRPPVAGECISFACTVNDRDGGEVDAFSGMLVMGLFNGIYGGKDIGKYGWIVLGE